MPTNIGVQLAEAVEALNAPADLAQSVMRRAGARRRRRLGAAGLLTAIAIAAAVAIPTAVSSDSSGVSRLSPATPSPSASPSPARSYPSINGVDLTSLPQDFAPAGQVGIGKSYEGGPDVFAQSFQKPTAGAADSDGSGPLITVGVQRAFSADLDQLYASSPRTMRSWLTVQGNRALLRQFKDTTSVPAATTRSSLEWVQDDTTLAVTAVDGATLDQALSVANGLRIGAQPAPPSDLAAAAAAVKDAVFHAFTGGQPASAVLGAIENGDQLAPVLAQLTREHPDTEQSARIAIGKITFLDSSHAIAESVVNFTYNGPVTPWPIQAGVNLTGSGWKVSQASYCSLVSLAVPACRAK